MLEGMPIIDGSLHISHWGYEIGQAIPFVNYLDLRGHDFARLFRGFHTAFLTLVATLRLSQCLIPFVTSD